MGKLITHKTKKKLSKRTRRTKKGGGIFSKSKTGEQLCSDLKNKIKELNERFKKRNDGKTFELNRGHKKRLKELCSKKEFTKEDKKAIKKLRKGIYRDYKKQGGYLTRGEKILIGIDIAILAAVLT